MLHPPRNHHELHRRGAAAWSEGQGGSGAPGGPCCPASGRGRRSHAVAEPAEPYAQGQTRCQPQGRLRANTIRRAYRDAPAPSRGQGVVQLDPRIINSLAAIAVPALIVVDANNTPFLALLGLAHFA